MSRILLLALLGCALIALAVSSESVEEKVENENQVLRVERSADPLATGKKDNDSQQKSASKKRRMKAKKQRQRQRRKQLKKAKKSAKGKRRRTKSGKRASKKGMKKSRGDKKKRRGSRKDRQQKKRLKAAAVKKAKKSKSSRQTACTSDTGCLNLAFTYLNNARNKVVNYQKQLKRIKKFTSVVDKKGQKKGDYNNLKGQLVEAAGGNASDVSCNGQKGSAGAKKIKTIIDKFDKCKGDIEAACNQSIAFNQTEANACDAKMTSFASEVDKCVKLLGAAACTCWKGATLKTLLPEIKKCDLSSVSTAMATFKSSCVKKVSGCNSGFQEASDAIDSCSSSNSVDKLLVKLKTAKAIETAIKDLQAAIDKLLAAVRQKTSRRRNIRQAACSSFIDDVKKLAEMVDEAPLSPSSVAKAKMLAANPPTDCTSANKAALQDLKEEVADAAEELAETIESLQSGVEGQTGSTASSDDIDKATESPTATRRFRRSAPLEQIIIQSF